jgi:sirohydrochlorin cobaltochelatase
MDQRIVLAVDTDVDSGLEAARRCARQLSYELGEPVLVVDVTTPQLDVIRAAALRADGLVSGQELRSELRSAPAVSAAPMAAAPFLWREDGRPDWGNMWQSFCELALFGGPPHRGEEQALHARPTAGGAPDSNADSIAEIQRGIWETTGLSAEPAEPGWLAVACESPKMAAWLCATILLENVDARCAGSTLFVPAAPSFEIKDEVKSVITVLAKTHHYWQAHLSASGDRAGT